MKNPILYLGVCAFALAPMVAVAQGDAVKPPGPGEPKTNAVVSQSADGAIKLLAREASIHGTTVRYEPQPHKNTIGYWTKAEDWVSWEVKVHQPGSFYVTVTQACGKGSGGSEYTLSIGDQTLRDKVSDTGAFTNFVDRQIGVVKLTKPGAYSLAVKPVTKPGVAVMDLRAVTLKPGRAD